VIAAQQGAGKWQRWCVALFLQAFQYFLSEFFDNTCASQANNVDGRPSAR
jgi:hypothetical protein